jgi:hypothetical protein
MSGGTDKGGRLSARTQKSDGKDRFFPANGVGEMNVGLHDAERDRMPGKTFPNYALMKISAYHKARGDRTEWWNPLKKYDVVYSSKVFDFTPENPYLPEDAVKGGTGYDVKSELPSVVEIEFPDYGIYPRCDFAVGFLTRGCPNRCSWCVVPEKEGKIRPYLSFRNIARNDTDKIVLMDNNALASEWALVMLNDFGPLYRIDFNQGLDARLVTPEIADILSRQSWIRFIRFSCDRDAQVDAIVRVARFLGKRGIKPYRLFVYLLVTADVEDAARRVDALKKLKGITLYAQAERNETKGVRPNAAQLEFARRYVYGGSYRKETWKEYCEKRGIENA